MGEKKYWSITDFSEGYIDKIDNHLIPENATPDCQNVYASQIGALVKRRGQERLNSSALGGAVTGLHSYYIGSSRYIVAASNGRAYYWDGTGFQLIKDGLSAQSNVYFERCVNYLVAFNGSNAPWKWDGSSATALANAPSDGQFCLLFKEKLFTVPASSPSTLRWSDSFQPESWPAVNYWDVKKGDGDVITCLRAVYGDLFVFKRRSLHVLQGTSLDDFRLIEQDGTTGCVGFRAAAVSGPYLYFVGDDGLYAWTGARAVNISAARIPKLWGSINKAYLHKACAVAWNNMVWFALPEGSSQTNNLIIVYDPGPEGGVEGKFWIYRGINASCFTVFNSGDGLKLYSGDYSGYVNQQDCGYTDFGSPINAYWVSKYYDAGSSEHRKKVKKAFVRDCPGANDVDVKVSFDYGSWQALTEYQAGEELLRKFRCPPNVCRYAAVRLEHSASSPAEVRGVTVEYKVKQKVG